MHKPMEKPSENSQDGSGSTAPEDASLNLMPTVPEEKLALWLREFFGKEVRIIERTLLRHRDLSYVERLKFDDALPGSLIYKVVLPPWDIEQDLHERILIPSISNSPQLFMAAHHGQATAMFMEDLGTDTLIGSGGSSDIAKRIGEELAKMHRSYSYRTDELIQLNILRSLSPIDYESFTDDVSRKLSDWGLVDKGQRAELERLGRTLAPPLAGEPISLVHGDLYAENIILRGERLFIIDWSWFTNLGVPLIDLATLALEHHKNGAFGHYRNELIESYCFESGRTEKDVRTALPYAETLSRLLFLEWLVERKSRGIEGTTVGPVDNLMRAMVDELGQRLNNLGA